MNDADLLPKICASAENLFLKVARKAKVFHAPNLSGSVSFASALKCVPQVDCRLSVEPEFR
jgi:hypothetical protein